MSTPQNQKFSDRLRITRELRKLSQAELAQKAGLQPSAISHFETGRRSPSFDNLKRLADSLGVSMDYLFGRTDEPAGSGGIVARIARHAGQLSQSDLEAVDQLAELLAKKSKHRSE